MFMPLAVCSAALSGALVLTMVGSAVGVDEPGRAVSSARSVRAVLAVPLAVPTTPAAPVIPADGPPQAVTGATRAAATAAPLGDGS